MNTRLPQVILTRTRSGNTEWGRHLTRSGFEVISLPVIVTQSLAITSHLIQAIRDLPTYDWLVLTSAAAVAPFQAALAQIGLNTQLSDRVKLAVIGQKTATAASTAGLDVSFTPHHPSAKSLANELPIVTGSKVLYLCSQRARPDLHTLLTLRGAGVTSVPLYTSIPDPDLSASLSDLNIELKNTFIVIASPSALDALMSIASEKLRRQLRATTCITFGSSLTQATHLAGFAQVIEVEKPSIDSVIEAILKTRSPI